ncbi:response regulator transcription factor [Clostridium sp. C2-6-12]|uniref:response regulator transcription factor n=1 Tax=Clostridium sp. C2-6-12 TaxID=2698832 RepID=UPI00137158C2|nr:response regulator transcription factor [Clostridium sp. C2-6-12]
MAYTILITDDDKDIIELLRLYIENEGNNVIIASNGKEALDLVRTSKVDCILLDIMMPEMNGFQLIKEIRKEIILPVIFLTAKNNINDKILGLDLGADDYIVKPFDPIEVIARINANIRRFYNLNTDEKKDSICLYNGNIKLDLCDCIAYENESRIELTSTEFRILKLFMEAPGRVYTKQQIFEAGWGEYSVVDDNSIMVCISKLRGKFVRGNCIKNIRGLGYRMEKINE